MVLLKGGRREDAIMRRVVFAATGVTRVRPPGEATAGRDVYRWTHQAFVQRTLCEHDRRLGRPPWIWLLLAGLGRRRRCDP